MENSIKDWYAMSDKALLAVIGQFIKDSRLNKNKTQQQLAMASDISRSTLVKLEKGEGGNLESFIRVMRILEQLHVFQFFEIKKQISPIELARIEQAKRKRAGRQSKIHLPKNESAW